MREITPQAPNEFANFTWYKTLQYVLIILAFAFSMAFIGPYGTYERLTVEDRYFFWLSVITIGCLQSIFFNYAMRGFTHDTPFSGWPTFLASITLTSIPSYFQVLLFAGFATGDSEQNMAESIRISSVVYLVMIFHLIQWLALERWSLSRKSMSYTQQQPLLISSAEQIKGPPATDRTTLDLPAAAQPPETLTTTEMEAPPLIQLSTMPKGLTGSILYIRVEDHYLRITTTDGEGLILQRLRDAVADLKEQDGLQVHRSWWVAQTAIDKIITQNRQKVLILTNGQHVPVSRTYLPALKAAGWLS